MKLNYRLIEGIGIIKILGRLDASNSNELKDTFRTYILDTAYFIIDCSDLEFVDSTGLGAIISILKTCTEHKGDIIVCSLQEKPAMLFEITRAFKIFEVYDNLKDAMAALKTEMN